MKHNFCKKCGCIDLHTEVKGNNTGLYCDKCGVWQKWLNKDELRAFTHDKGNDKTVIERLIKFKEFLDKEIDKQYSKLPISNEDGIRKYTYCYALQKVVYSIENIIENRDFNDIGD